MCGIAGYIDFGDAEAPFSAIAQMTGALARRGPDGEGVATWPGVALGHRRLAIIDLSDAGKQPMLSSDGDIGLVFNGCIYNFQDLRHELEQSGYSFRSRCDTEVILAGYRCWGIDKLVPKLRGMFAFAIWDHNRRVLHLVRDRFGVKPLLYVDSGSGRIAFASTLDALRSAGVVGSEIDQGAVLEYLEYGFVTDRLAIFSGVRKVPPATIITWSEKKIEERCYWQLPEPGTARPSFEEAVEETEKRLIECVRLRLIADVPVAALLSGGIDSALVCWALAKLNADVTAYTVSTPGDPADESAAAAATARALGIRYETITLEDSVRRDSEDPLGSLIGAFSEPFACQSALGMLRLSQTIKPRATVLLTGDGGDDVFLGYPFFLNAWRAQRLSAHLPESAPRLWNAARSWLPKLGPLRRASHFLDYAVGGMGAHNRVRPGIAYLRRRNLLGERIKELDIPQRQIPASLASARKLLSETFHHHLRTHFSGEFLPKVDGGTMYYGLEARAPFLDHTMWEFAATLPPEIHFHSGRLKSVLREIVQRRISREAASRPKQGFRIPAEKWLGGRWSGYLDLLRSDSLVAAEGWIHKQELDAEIARAAVAKSAPEWLWYVAVLESWMRKQKAGANLRPALAPA